jgi:gamma-glutamyltranspeptidase
LLASILEAPRWDLDPLGRVRVEARAPGECRRLLRRAGHEAVRGGPWEGAGYVQAIQIAADGGLLGATDPRGEGIALGI